MISGDDLFYGIAIGVILIVLYKNIGKITGTGEVEKFCPRGYCEEDENKATALHKRITSQYPCYSNYKILGYDNPYIYPYNYDWNQNHPIDRFKHPSWVRQLEIDDDKTNQFPGYKF